MEKNYKVSFIDWSESDHARTVFATYAEVQEMYERQMANDNFAVVSLYVANPMDDDFICISDLKKSR